MSLNDEFQRLAAAIRNEDYRYLHVKQTSYSSAYMGDGSPRIETVEDSKHENVVMARVSFPTQQKDTL